MRVVKGVAAAGAFVIIAAAGILTFGRFSYAPLPNEADLLNPERLPIEAAYDVMGRAVTQSEADALQSTPEGQALLSPAAHAVATNEAVRRVGRDAFYRETYGNEVFLTDVLGLIDGGLSPTNVAWAILKLAGRGTSDLHVTLARDVQIGDRLYRKGEEIATGLGVPKGGMFPLGIRTFYDRGHIRMGITCALCHSTVDAASGKVVEGAPNTGVNLGLMMALASNPAGYFMHTGVQSLAPYQTDPARSVRSTDGTSQTLPDPVRLAADVRAYLGTWPRGSFDSSPDLVNNPTSIPSSFTARGEPYGWSGHAGIGPFRGLSALNNNVHGLNSDTTAQYKAAPVLFGLDPELYLATLLQDAPDHGLRFDPARDGAPSAFLTRHDPTPDAPGLNSYAVLPSYPSANYVTSNSLIASRPGEPIEYSIDAMSVFQNTLRPPAVVQNDQTAGRAVFERAGCVACHSGPALTNNRIIPVDEIGTEPTRAKSFARTEATIAQPQLFASDERLPPSSDAKRVDMPVPDRAQLELAWAHHGTNGGYKVPALVGLAWSAPYLHDGGVAVGPDAPTQIGVAALDRAGALADPHNSLRALVDRGLRTRVVEANRAAPSAATSHITGEGHRFWVDAEAGYSSADQNALLSYLLSITSPR